MSDSQAVPEAPVTGREAIESARDVVMAEIVRQQNVLADLEGILEQYDGESSNGSTPGGKQDPKPEHIDAVREALNKRNGISTQQQMSKDAKLGQGTVSRVCKWMIAHGELEQLRKRVKSQH